MPETLSCLHSGCVVVNINKFIWEYYQNSTVIMLTKSAYLAHSRFLQVQHPDDLGSFLNGISPKSQNDYDLLKARKEEKLYALQDIKINSIQKVLPGYNFDPVSSIIPILILPKRKKVFSKKF